MDTLILIVSIALFVAAIRAHAIAQAFVTTKTERQWFERLFTGSRAPKDTLTEEGLRYRKQSDFVAIGGFLMISVYVWLKFTA